MQATEACFIVQPATPVPGRFSLEELLAATRRDATVLCAPLLWSCEDAYHRNGGYSSACEYVADVHGGALKGMPLFEADIAPAAGRSTRQGDSTKFRLTHYSLSPGSWFAAVSLFLLFAQEDGLSFGPHRQWLFFLR
jgi:hypothetical protein